MRLGTITILASLVPGVALVAACGDASSSANNGGSGGGAAASGGGGAGGSGGVDVDSGGGNGGFAAGCAADSHTGELVPLDMFVMLDRSASMQDSSRWTTVTSALKQFVDLPDLEKLGMGIAFFPTPPSVPPPVACQTDMECGFYGPCMPIFFQCSGALGAANDSCVATDYQKPVVPIADLPGVGPQIKSAIDAQGPDGASTPIAPALEGAIDYAVTSATQHPERITVVVLATDGEPTNCMPNTVADAEKYAAEGLAQAPSVKTFVIGVGDLTALKPIAVAGGTEDVIPAGNGGAAFLDALNKIRGAVVCNYQIPQSTGGPVDTGKVNVGFTPEGGELQKILQVENATKCLGGPGWYYDNPASPTQIILCPASCDLVKNQKGKLDILIGCKTEVR